MAETTSIEWTDATWNPITGCSVISPGCTNCYAMKLAGTRLRGHQSRAGLTRETKGGHVWTGEVRFNKQWLDQPLRWRNPHDIFVVAHGDLFNADVPDEWIDRVFAVMTLAPQHRFQVLTKRPDRMLKYFSGGRSLYQRVLNAARPLRNERPTLGDIPIDDPGAGAWHRNILLGTSVEDQTRATERRQPLAELAMMGWNTWVGYEPALGPVDWTQWDFIKWLVSGGENGPRPSHPDWHRAARDFCVAHGVPYFFKQWGSWAPGGAFGLVQDGPLTDKWGNVKNWMRRYVVCDDRADHVDAHSFTQHATDLVYNVGKKRAGAMLDGREWKEMPQ